MNLHMADRRSSQTNLSRPVAHARAGAWQPDRMATQKTGPAPNSRTREPPPTPKQIYAIARELLDDAGVPWPATRREASELIARLRDEQP
jgi:hypothetical protein